MGGCTAKWAGWLAGGCSPFIVRGAAGIGIGIAIGVGVLHVSCHRFVFIYFPFHPNSNHLLPVEILSLKSEHKCRNGYMPGVFASTLAT